MAKQSMAQSAGRVIVGVDTHKDVHVARAKDGLGRALDQISVPASTNGCRRCSGGLASSAGCARSGSREPGATEPG
jgi:transposase